MAEAKKIIHDCFVSVIAVLPDHPVISSEFITQASTFLKEHYTNYELVLIDNAVDQEVIDRVKAKLEDHPCVRVMRLSQRYDREVALFAGIEAAIGDYAVVLDPITDPTVSIGALVDKLRDGYDIIYGVSNQPIHRSLLGKAGASLFYWYGQKFLFFNIPKNSTYLIALNRRAINALTRVKGRYRHVRHLTRSLGFKSSIMKYDPLRPIESASRTGLLGSANLAMEIIVSYSSHPLRLVTWLGLIASFLNLLYGFYAVGIYFFKSGVAQGWTTLSLQASGMFFLVFIILAVLSEYIGRILQESRRQPSYHIMEELNSTVLIADETRRNVTAA